MRRALLLALPVWLVAAPLAAQTAGQGAGSLLNPLDQRLTYPQGTVNPGLMPRPGGNTGAGGTSGSQAIPNPNGGLPSGAAAADGQTGATGARRGGGGGGGLAPGVTPVPSASGRSGGSGRAASAGGSGSAAGAFTASGGRSGGGRSGGAGARGGSARGGSNSSGSSPAAAPVGRAAQWVLCPGDDSEIAAELGGGMSCAP